MSDSFTEKVNTDNISIILVRPRFPENIGAAARAMLNMGIRRLIIVSPENYDLAKINKMATHFASDVIENAKIYDNVREASAEFSYVFGTTARLGRHRQAVFTPSRMAEKLLEISKDNTAAVMFGPEDKGLSKEDTRYCHHLVNIPTEAFSSLNLAQAVMVVCYEIFKPRGKPKKGYAHRLATRRELDIMYDQLKEILVRISYIHWENPDHWVDKLRKVYTRFEPRAGEVSIIRGICRQINWYGEKRYQDGLKDAAEKEEP